MMHELHKFKLFLYFEVEFSVISDHKNRMKNVVLRVRLHAVKFGVNLFISIEIMAQNVILFGWPI